MSRHAGLRALIAAFGLLVGVSLVIDKQSSELAIWGLCGLLFLPLPIVALFLMLAEKWKILLYFLVVPVLLGFFAFQGFDWLYWPRNIHFKFWSPPGASGSYHVVGFEHKVGDRWIEGPTVEGWSLRVAFPDLNSDGYRDIRIVEENSPSEDAIEFVYISNPTDGIYWKTHRMNSRLSVTYKPAGISFHQP